MIRRRFRVIEIESPEGQLSKLVQITTVEDYQTHFEDMALRTTNLSDEFLIPCFVSGLRPDIKNEVLGHRSNSMSEVLPLAQFYEAKFNETRKVMNRMPNMKLPHLLPTPTTCPSMSKAQTSHPLPS
ncbi:hypothetical protein F3Y22_tig00112349pilonHSYRG00098 [Hibiscus syriacus]|uniref:Uncharacterized protein n=1 Tax=Hibiscus syriacus TaxID=106335 RepID=A0A6A2X0X5_HIBSY|nr:hypothetical protein F3Y22_tig00112349pilonHSYRG00098 [Hibiscus syriacus]